MKLLFTSLRMFVGLSLLTGVFYTGMVTAIGEYIFPYEAKGSLIVERGTIRGSELIGQEFSGPGYFRSRPSAVAHNPLPSGGSNLAVAGARLRDSVEERRRAFARENRLGAPERVPSDMLFASGSGLDPHSSPQAARMQIGRVAGERRFTDAKKTKLAALVERSIEPPQMGFLGRSRVNVARLNRALDSLEAE